jgi:hypothetical protein
LRRILLLAQEIELECHCFRRIGSMGGLLVLTAVRIAPAETDL